MAIYPGSASGDHLNGDGDSDVFTMEDGGDDYVSGGGGFDFYYFGATLTADDTVVGGSGSDYVYISGDYSAGLTLGDHFTGINALTLQASGAYDLTLTDGGVAANQRLDIVVEAVTDLSLDASAETDGLISVQFQSVFDTNWTLKGGSELGDQIIFSGDYGALTFLDSTSQGFENMTFNAGHDYDITFQDANMGEGFAIQSAYSASGDSLRIDASAETSSNVSFFVGAADDTMLGGDGDDRFQAIVNGGADSLSGGGGDDLFVFNDGVGPNTLIDGGSGSDTLSLNPSAGLDFFADGSRFSGIETIETGGDVRLTLDDAFTAAGETLTIQVYSRFAPFILYVRGEAEKDAHLDVTGGDLADRLVGGAMADSLDGAGGGDLLRGGRGRDVLEGYSGADTIAGGGGRDVLDGGAGVDVFQFGARCGSDLIHGLAYEDVIDVSKIDAVDGGGDDAFTMVGEFTGHAGELMLDYSGRQDLTRVLMDTDGDGSADLVIRIEGDHTDFTNFVL